MKQSLGKQKILMIEDNPEFAGTVNSMLGEAYSLVHAEDVQSSYKFLTPELPSLVLLDFDLPNISGLDFLRILKRQYPCLPVIMLTGHKDAETIISTMQMGATDYVIKGTPDLETNLKFRIFKALERNDLIEINEKLKSKMVQENQKYEILGTTKEIIKLKTDILRLKNSNVFVLITGENGTGKEMIARNLNIQENEPGRPFVAVNCAGISPNLFESEFFGHKKGSFTGAIEDKIGKFEAANGGDIFLDEIGEIPLDLQAKLLRVLQEREFTPVGSNKTFKVDIRVIAATNRNLTDEILKGKFREDLFYRLNQIQLSAPSLRERPQDIIYLAEHFLKRTLPMAYLTNDSKKLLLEHGWRGNIRELLNTIERACVFAKGGHSGAIKPEHLNMIATKFTSTNSGGLAEKILPISESDISENHFQNSLKLMEKLYLDRCLEIFNGDNSAVYERIKISKAKYFRRKKVIADVLNNQNSGTL